MVRFHHNNIYNPYEQKINCTLYRSVRFSEYKEPQKGQLLQQQKQSYGSRSENIYISGKKIKKFSATHAM